MSCSLNSLKGLYMGSYRGVLWGLIGIIKRHTRSLDSSSNGTNELELVGIQGVYRIPTAETEMGTK